MTILISCLSVFFIVFLGLTLNLKVINFFDDCRLRVEKDAFKDLFQGLLPGLVLVGMLAMLMCIFQVFYFHAFMGASLCLLFLFRDQAFFVMKVIRSGLRDVFYSFAYGNPLPAISITTLLLFLIYYLVASQFPAEYTDVWVFQFPIAKSIVVNHGFVIPQIDDKYYGNLPFFLNVIFACGLLFEDNWVVINLLNVIIFLGFIALFLGLSKQCRPIIFLIAMILIVVAAPYFRGSVAMPMTDLPRSCFSIAGILFAWSFAQTKRIEDLIHSGLCIGASVASKYTELQSIGLVGLIVLPILFLVNDRRRIVLAFFLPFLGVSAYWYLKNLFLFGNPIYPFIFGHPGLSEQWMSNYMIELGRAFDPANRHFVTNLLTLQGWSDFLFILHSWFLSGKTYIYFCIGVIVAGLIAQPSRVGSLVAVSFLMFVVWYVVMFNHVRWAMPALLIFHSTAIISFIIVLEKWIIPLLSFVWNIFRKYLKYYKVPRFTALTFSIIFISLFYFWVTTSNLLNGELKNHINLALNPDKIEQYLNQKLPTYEIYRYIGENELRTVFQPFDVANTQILAAYNGGREEGLMLPRYILPESSDIDEFLTANQIRYFVIPPEKMKVIIAERMGSRGEAIIAWNVVNKMIPKSSLILEDSFGWRLYKYNDSTNQDK